MKSDIQIIYNKILEIKYLLRWRKMNPPGNLSTVAEEVNG